MSIYELLKTEPIKYLNPWIMKKLYGSTGPGPRSMFSRRLNGQKFTPDEEKKIKNILKKLATIVA